MTDICDSADETKFCPGCRQDLPVTDFTRDSRRKDGVSFYCRGCLILRDVRSRHKRNGAPRKRVKPRCRPCFAAAAEASRGKVHGSSRNHRLKRRYGITAEHYDQMLAEQRGLCTICREAPGDQVDRDQRHGPGARAAVLQLQRRAARRTRGGLTCGRVAVVGRVAERPTRSEERR